LEVCGSASAYSLPEAKNALNNGVYQLAVASLTKSDQSDPAQAQAYGVSLIQISPKGNVSDTLKISRSGSTYTFTIGTSSPTTLDTNSSISLLNQWQQSNLKTEFEFEAKSPSDLQGVQTVQNLSSLGNAVIQPNSSLLIYDDSNPRDSAILIKNSGPTTQTIVCQKNQADGQQPADQSYHVFLAGDDPHKSPGSSLIAALIAFFSSSPTSAPTLTFSATLSLAHTSSGDSGLTLPYSLLVVEQASMAAKAPGKWANGMQVNVEAGSSGNNSESRVTLKIYPNAAGDQAESPIETFRDKSWQDINRASTLITLNQGRALLNDNSVIPPGLYVLAGGSDPSTEAYSAALTALHDEPDVDLVLASLPAEMIADDRLKIFDAIKSHCEQASTASHPRIGFGQLPKDFTDAKASDWSSKLNSERFVLVAPHGTAAAVAGRVGSLDYFASPTFKTLSGLDDLNPTLPLETQENLLKANLLPVSFRRGRGYIMVRGLTTSGGQISVCRIADRAVRGVQMIGELFIGTLNNEDGRNALRQKITEFLMQMKNEGALVPSTDGKSPPFSINVYSSEADFAQGIVRIDLAVRPVRSIDFIYATILVQA
jgi:hypothetical protein